MKISVFSLVLFIAAAAFFPGPVVADQRAYVWTYQYLTVPAGSGEIETYFTLSVPNKGNMKGNTFSEHRFELEVGMTERFDFAVYQIFSQAPEGSIKYDGFQLRARFKLGQKDRYPFDPLVYVEYRGVPDFSENEWEFRFILAKDRGPFNISVNPILEYRIGEKQKIEPGYALGISYAVHDLLRLGMEARGSEDGHYIGPVISHGKDRFWVALGSALHIGTAAKGKPDLQIRMLLGIGL